MLLGVSRSLKHWAPAAVLATSLVTLAATTASASVRRQGTWPDSERGVTLKLDAASRGAALRQLADAAGWSIVSRSLPETPVSIDVRDQPPAKVLELLLADGEFEAVRDGTLISVGPVSLAPPAIPAPAIPAPASSAQTPVPADEVDEPEPLAPPAAPPAPGAEPEDRSVTGGDLRIEANEVVGDVTVFGGNLDLLGTARGDVSVVGGSVRVHKGAHITGDASAVGGSLVIDDGAIIDGEVSVVGGMLDRDGDGNVRLELNSDDDSPASKLALGTHNGSRGSTLSRLVDDAGDAMERSVLLFVFGVILIALGSARMEMLETEVAARPMRSLALGVVGAIASLAAVVVLCVTVIGIPFAVVGMIAGLLLAAAGICAVLTTLGGALVGHRTKNPYLHLALGCFLFLLVGSIPYFGGFVTAAVTLIGIGTLVATRLAGFIPKRTRNGVDHGPYRTAAASCE